MTRTFVQSEFARLKSVVVAESEFIIPDASNTRDTDFLPSEEVEEFQKAAGKSFAEAFPDQQAAWEKEREELVRVLEGYGVEVLRPRKMTEFEKKMNGKDGASNFFIRDPFFTVGNYLIEGSMRFPHRRYEVLPVRKILMERALESGCRYLAVPRADISEGYDSEAGPYLEGGDVLVLDKNVFVGKSGLASNDNGYLWLKCLLEPEGYHVEQVCLQPDVLHLDCAISLVREGLMIVSTKALLNGLPEVLKSWDQIEVEPEQIQYLAVNGLPVDESHYIADPVFRHTIGKELEARGIHVDYIDFHITRKMGGSFRCSTQALLRE
jgi:N-dimethylarginine dimethylaminohydrolase